MKKLIIVSLGTALALSAWCASTAKRAPMTPEQMEKLKAARMKQTGGFLPIKGKGSLAVFNSQTQVKDETLQDCLKPLKTFIQGLNIQVKNEPFALSSAKATREKNGAGACVYLVDDATLPMSLIALEDGWAVVNVAPLSKDNPEAAKLALRFKKEFIRVSSVLFSGAKSQYKTSPLQSVTSVAELDKVMGENYGMDSVVAIGTHLPEIGVVPDRRTTYKRACEEGWAPMPTNEYQRAIWEKVHTLPTNPIQIKPEAKKVSE